MRGVSRREAPAAAAARARELDRFCADAVIEVASNVVGQFGAHFAAARVKGLGLEQGLSETASGSLVSYATDGSADFVLRPLDDPAAKTASNAYAGLTFALDLPQVRDPVSALSEMAQVAQAFADELAGEVVDDKRKPLTEQGLASIRR